MTYISYPQHWSP